MDRPTKESIQELGKRIAAVDEAFDTLWRDIDVLSDDNVARSEVDLDLAISELIWEWKNI